MDTKIVNLRRAKKALARAASRAEAAASAAKHGRSKSEKAAEEASRTRAARHLDDHRLDRGATSGETDPS